MTTKKEDVVIEAKAEPKFSKSQIVKSETFKSKKDLVNALLEDGMLYTKAEVKKIIDDYLKGRVN